MEYFGIFIRVTCFLIIVGSVHCESIEELLSRLSEKINKIDQSYEKRFDASIDEINERLDRIENVLGINDQDLKGTRKGKAIWADIQNTKHRLLKAFKNQKQHLNKVVSEYEGKFEELKQGVKDTMSEINNTVVDTTLKVNGTLLQNSNNLNESLKQLETKTDGQFREVSSKIDIISHDNTMKNISMALYQKTIDNRFITLESTQSLQGTKVRTLDSSVSSLRSNLSSTESAVSSLRSSINSLEETKVAFSVFLKSTTQYDHGQVIIFDGVLQNHGNGYSRSTGKFTAPKSGTYLFSISVEGTYKMQAYAYIMIYQRGSEIVIGQAFAHKAEFVTGSNSVVDDLSQGDQVWAETVGNCEFYIYRTSLMGVLLDE